jgi:hypothetical protein
MLGPRTVIEDAVEAIEAAGLSHPAGTTPHRAVKG